MKWNWFSFFWFFCVFWKFNMFNILCIRVHVSFFCAFFVFFKYLFDFPQHFKDSEILNQNYKNRKAYDSKE